MAQPTLTPREFAKKWGDEGEGCLEHFIDPCRMLREPTPSETDPAGTTHAFQDGRQREKMNVG